MGYSTNYCLFCRGPLNLSGTLPVCQTEFIEWTYRDVVGIYFDAATKRICISRGDVDLDFPSFTPKRTMGEESIYDKCMVRLDPDDKCKGRSLRSKTYTNPRWLWCKYGDKGSGDGFAYCAHKRCWDNFFDMMKNSSYPAFSYVETLISSLNEMLDIRHNFVRLGLEHAMYGFGELVHDEMVKGIDYGKIINYTGQDFFECIDFEQMEEMDVEDYFADEWGQYADESRLPYVFEPLSALEFSKFLLYGIGGLNKFGNHKQTTIEMSNIHIEEETDEKTINDLPIEILLKILHLVDGDSINNMSMTCRGMYVLCNVDIYPSLMVKEFNKHIYNMKRKKRKVNNDDKVEGEMIKVSVNDINTTLRIVFKLAQSEFSYMPLKSRPFVDPVTNYKILYNSIRLSTVNPFDLSNRQRLSFTILNTIRVFNIQRQIANKMIGLLTERGILSSHNIKIALKLQLMESEIDILQPDSISLNMFELDRVLIVKFMKDTKGFEEIGNVYLSAYNLPLKESDLGKRKRPADVSQPTTNKVKRRKITNNNNEQDKPPMCADCGIEMVLRTNKKTSEKFWGCNNYFNAEIKCKKAKKYNK